MVQLSHWLSILFREIIKFCEPVEIIAFGLTNVEISENLQVDSLWQGLSDKLFSMIDWPKYRQYGQSTKELYLIATDRFNLCQLC